MTPAASAVFALTVLPHQVRMFVSPIVPFAGYCRQKKMTMIEIARPESRPADRMSACAYPGQRRARGDEERVREGDAQLYLVHHEKWRRRMT